MSNRKQTFRLRNYSFRNILMISSGVMLGLFAFLTLVPPTNPNQAALATIDPEIYDLTVTATDATIDVSPVGGVSVAKSTVTSTTLSPAGYKLYISTDSDSNTAFLNGDSSNIEDYKKIVATAGTFASPAALTADSSASWGYAIAGFNNFDSSYETASQSSKFAAVPEVSEPQLIHTHTGASADGSELDVYFGAKATTNIVAGDYSASIVFSSISDATSETEEEAGVMDGGVVEKGYDSATFAVKTSLRSSLMAFTPSDVDVAVANKACDDIVITEQAPLTLTASAPEDLSVGEYDIVVSVPKLGKTYRVAKGLKIVEKSAKAILGTNGNLNFVYDINTYVAGETYTDNLGETEINTVYPVPTKGNPQWQDNNNILSANFEESFYEFEPTSTEKFFYHDRYLAKLTNGQYLNTSQVTDMSSMFERVGYDSEDATWIIEGIENWDTSKVKNMVGMFEFTGRNATTWSIGNIGNWNTGSVTDMTSMFDGAGHSATTWTVGDLSGWDVSSVTSMFGIFASTGYSATTWTVGDLSGWDVSSVTSTREMFFNSGRNATTWTVGDLSRWNTGAVTEMYRMFGYTGKKATEWFIGDLSDWDVSKVKYMGWMFYEAGYDTTTWSIGDLSGWNVSSVTDMNSMFEGAGYKAEAWTIGDIGNWNTSSVTNMSYMFADAGHNATTWSIGNLDDWKTGSVTNMTYMFTAAGQNDTAWTIGDLSGWDVSSVTNMYYMFGYNGYKNESWSIGDLSGWDVSKVTDMGWMFYEAGNHSKDWTVGDLSGWVVSSVTNMYGMFEYAGANAQTWSVGDISGWDTSSVTNMTSMFRNAGKTATYSLDLSGWNVNKVTSYSNFNYSVESKITPPIWKN